MVCRNHFFLPEDRLAHDTGFENIPISRSLRGAPTQGCDVCPLCHMDDAAGEWLFCPEVPKSLSVFPRVY